MLCHNTFIFAATQLQTNGTLCCMICRLSRCCVFNHNGIFTQMFLTHDLCSTTIGGTLKVLLFNAVALVFACLIRRYTDWTVVELVFGMGEQRHMLGVIIDWALILLACFNISGAVATLLHQLWIRFTLVPVSLTIEQKKLLGISEDDTRFQSPSKAASRTPDPSSPASPYVLSDLSWLFHLTPKKHRSPGSPSVGSASGTPYSFRGSVPASPNDYEVASFGERYFPASSELPYRATTPYATYDVSVTDALETVHRGSSYATHVFEVDQSPFSSILRKRDKTIPGISSSPAEHSPRSHTSWQPSPERHAVSRTLSSTRFAVPSKTIDFSSLAQYQYQPSQNVTIDSVSGPGSTLVHAAGSVGGAKPAVAASDRGADPVWSRYGVTSAEMVETQSLRLRLWISETILKPLLEEMESLNAKSAKTATANRAADFVIGESSLLHLQSIAASKFDLYPTMGALLPYLELSPNQGYLVKRLRELGKRDACLKEFRWNSGSSYKNKPWDDALPTDSNLIMHLFATYMNSVLPLHPFYSEGKAFSAQYFLQHPLKPPAERKPGLLMIYQNSTSPPNYQLLIGDEMLEVEKGRNNLFNTLLLFFHHLKLKCGGRLDCVSLGENGVNIMWMFE